MAAAIGFVLFYAGLPLFRDLSGQPLSMTLSAEAAFWYMFAALFLVGSLLSGLYPAFVLSSFQPSAVLKGRFQSTTHGQQLRKGLVVFQFAATVALMICMATVHQQVNYLRAYDLGMLLDHTLVLRSPRLNMSDSVYHLTYQTFKDKLLQNPDIQRMARSESVPGLSLHELSTTSGIKQLGHEETEGGYNYYMYNIDADFIPALNMRFAAGRNFEAGTPNFDQVIINEEAVTRLGFANAEEAIGAKLTYKTRWNGEHSTVIGVLKNFYQRSPKETHIPMIFKYDESASYLSLRLKTDHVQETIASVKRTWNEMFPGMVFEYFFLDQSYDQQYQADARFGRVIATFSALAVFIACLGLFGLSSFTIVRRTREIGIRKVLGASVVEIVRLLSQDFLKVVMIASLLALPLSYFAMQEWLSNYAVRIGLNGWIFIFPVMVILTIALITVSFQTIKTALSNPVNSLKQE